MKSEKNNSGKQYIVYIIAAVLIIAAISGSYMFRADAVKNEGEIYIPEGTEFKELLGILREGDFINHPGRFSLAARLLKVPDHIRPGHYSITDGTSYTKLARMFKHGLQTPVRVTFNNVRSMELLSGRLASQLQADSVTLAAYLTADSVAGKYGFSRETFPSMFIPDTYEFYWTVSPAAFTDRMHSQWNAFWAGERDRKREELGLSRDQVYVLASIVYEETKLTPEMPTVAGVYINRLKKGMLLQADPTVKFAIGDPTIRRVLNRHLEVDSPYNTYRNAGLPPGPICMPSVAAIDGVLNYQRHNYIYFCARPDFSGYHNFAVTHAEHNQNRAAWTAALNARGIR